MARKQLIGSVVSDRMQKTVVVKISRKVQHKLYKKMITVTNKLKADTNGIEAKIGDEVKIEQTRPLGGGKTFKVIEVLGGKK